MTKPNKQVAPQPGEDEDEILSSVDTVSSSTECTGLIQTPPDSEAEADAYAELYPIPRPVKKRQQQPRKTEHGTEE